MFGLGIPEIAVILIIALIIFGPNKLPDMAQTLGKGIREFKSSVDGIKEDVEASIGLDEEAKKDLQAALSLDGITQPMPKSAAESVPKPAVADSIKSENTEVKVASAVENAAVATVEKSESPEAKQENKEDSPVATLEKEEEVTAES